LSAANVLNRLGFEVTVFEAFLEILKNKQKLNQVLIKGLAIFLFKPHSWIIANRELNTF
jgi:hypothetical protein